ncbi:MAG: hypothetical protein EPN17_01870 [Methylobacter sp.]|nr:MAG: hypothetical protein EPN17_01870 [Methylobacter sp.]
MSEFRIKRKNNHKWQSRFAPGIIRCYWQNSIFLPVNTYRFYTKNANNLSPYVFALLASLWSLATLASTDDEIQVYNNAINAPGQFGLELHSNYVAEGTRIPAYQGDAPSYGSFRETSEFSYGLINNWEIGGYLPLLSRGGITRLEGGKLRVKYLKQEDNGLYYGFNTEVGHTTKRTSEQPWNQELRPIIGYYGEAWRVAFNPVLSWSLVGRDAFLPSFGPMLKVGRVVTGDLVLGVEHFTDLGMVHKIESLQHQGHNTYLVLDTTVADVNVNFGAGYGWTQDSDDWTVKLILGLPFNQMVDSLFR